MSSDRSSKEQNEIDRDHLKIRDLLWSREYKLRDSYIKVPIFVIAASWAISTSNLFPEKSYFIVAAIFISCINIGFSFLMTKWDAAHIRECYDNALEMNEDVDLSCTTNSSVKMEWLIRWEFGILILSIVCLLIGILDSSKINITFEKMHSVSECCSKVVKSEPINNDEEKCIKH